MAEFRHASRAVTDQRIAQQRRAEAFASRGRQLGGGGGRARSRGGSAGAGSGGTSSWRSGAVSAAAGPVAARGRRRSPRRKRQRDDSLIDLTENMAEVAVTRAAKRGRSGNGAKLQKLREERAEQDFAYNLGLAKERSQQLQAEQNKQAQQQQQQLDAILAQSRVTAREERLASWRHIAGTEPAAQSPECVTILFRFVQGGSIQRTFLRSDLIAKVVAFAGSAGQIPEATLDEDNWGVYTTYPKKLLGRDVIGISLGALQFPSRVVVHVGLLPVGDEVNKPSSLLA